MTDLSLSSFAKGCGAYPEPALACADEPSTPPSFRWSSTPSLAVTSTTDFSSSSLSSVTLSLVGFGCRSLSPHDETIPGALLFFVGCWRSSKLREEISLMEGSGKCSSCLQTTDGVLDNRGRLAARCWSSLSLKETSTRAIRLWVLLRFLWASESSMQEGFLLTSRLFRENDGRKSSEEFRVRVRATDWEKRDDGEECEQTVLCQTVTIVTCRILSLTTRLLVCFWAWTGAWGLLRCVTNRFVRGGSGARPMLRYNKTFLFYSYWQTQERYFEFLTSLDLLGTFLRRCFRMDFLYYKRVVLIFTAAENWLYILFELFRHFSLSCCRLRWCFSICFLSA